MVLRKDACHQIQQAGPVAGGNTEEPSLRFLVWLQRHPGGYGKALHSPRHPFSGGLGQGAACFNGAHQVAFDHMRQLSVMARLR